MKTTLKNLAVAHGLFAAAIMVGVCGCDRLPGSGADQEARARSSTVFANAMEDYQAGRVDAAIAGFEHVLKDDPTLYLAHFQLATLLQDVRKDYMGALVHYRAYLDMRPETDKTTLAQERSGRCKDLLAAEYAQKGGIAPNRKGDDDAIRKLEAENTRLAAESDRLKKENKNLRFLVSQMGASGVARKPQLNAEVKKLLAELRETEAGEEPSRRKTVIPTDAQLLDDDGEDAPIMASKDAKKQVADAKREDPTEKVRPAPIVKPPLIIDNTPAPEPKPAAGTATARTGGLNGLLGGEKKAAAPSRPDTYVVQPGDTLMHIAARFYGSRGKWRDIRNANLATIPADGRVKEGMTIKLP